MKRTKSPPQKTRWAYKQLWRVIDGAVYDALRAHPEYLTDAGRQQMRESVVKRVTGAVLGYAEQSAQGRSVEETAATRDPPLAKGSGSTRGVSNGAPCAGALLTPLFSGGEASHPPKRGRL